MSSKKKNVTSSRAESEDTAVFIESPSNIPSINHEHEEALFEKELANEMDREIEQERNGQDIDIDADTVVEEAAQDWKPDVTAEETDDQLDKLSKAMADEESRNASELETLVNPEKPLTPQEAALELKRQIEEDIALQAEDYANAQKQEEQLAAQMPLLSADDPNEVDAVVENFLFLADKPISPKRFKELLGESHDEALLTESLARLTERYQSVHHGMELAQLAGGYAFRTKPSLAIWVRKLAKVQTSRLSRGAMESLAIIAYRQPVMKEDIDKIRGVDSSHFIRTLLERKLVEVQGRSELPGRPMLYVTTNEFLEVFGLAEISAMPSLREIESMVPQSETRNPDEEDPKVLQIRKLVDQMKTDSSKIHYDPKADEVILAEIRERVGAISTTTPYLEEQKALEKEALAPQPTLPPTPDQGTLLS
jgi:segregation and condensation protein B